MCNRPPRPLEPRQHLTPRLFAFLTQQMLFRTEAQGQAMEGGGWEGMQNRKLAMSKCQVHFWQQNQSTVELQGTAVSNFQHINSSFSCLGASPSAESQSLLFPALCPSALTLRVHLDKCHAPLWLSLLPAQAAKLGGG